MPLPHTNSILPRCPACGSTIRTQYEAVHRHVLVLDGIAPDGRPFNRLTIKYTTCAVEACGQRRVDRFYEWIDDQAEALDDQAAVPAAEAEAMADAAGPWIDPLEEMTAACAEIMKQPPTAEEIAQEWGLSIEEVVAELAAAIEAEDAALEKIGGDRSTLFARPATPASPEAPEDSVAGDTNAEAPPARRRRSRPGKKSG